MGLMEFEGSVMIVMSLVCPNARTLQASCKECSIPYRKEFFMARLFSLLASFHVCLAMALITIAALAVPEKAFADPGACYDACISACGTDATCALACCDCCGEDPVCRNDCDDAAKAKNCTG